MSTNNAPPESIRLIFAKGTDVGCQREHNEDFVEAYNPPDPEQRRRKGLLFVVADGMGGHQAGEVASETAVQTISHEYYRDPDPQVAPALVRAIQKANAVIYERAQESIGQVGMGTTVVAAVARGPELVLANVGDSRAYLLRNGNLRQVTRDHSFVEEQIRAGVLTREEARAHPRRNVVTRALGPKPEVDVDTYGGKLSPGDVLLLCSDGLSEYVPDHEMEGILRQSTSQEAVDMLIALARDRGGGDNISALVVKAAPASDAAVGRPNAAATTQQLAAASQQVPATAPDRSAAAQDVPAPSPQGGGDQQKRGADPHQSAAAETQERPTAAPVSAASRSGLSRGMLVLLVVGIVLILAGVAAGVFLFAPGLAPTAETPTPMGTEVANATEPVASLVPTATPPVSGESTATPRVGFNLLEPRDGATFASGQQVNFRWSFIGTLPQLFTFVVHTNRPGFETVCRLDQESCLVALEPGAYEWWVEVWSGDRLILDSDRRTLEVRAAPTNTPPSIVAPTLTPVTIDVAPVDTPEGSDADG